MMSRSLRILLFVSLALNLLILGLAAGAVLSGGLRGLHPRAMELSVGPLSDALEDEDRRHIRSTLREMARSGEPTRMTRGAALAELIAAVGAEPFDRAAVAAILDEQGAGFATLQRAAQEAYLDRLVAMGPQGRAAYAERLADRARPLMRDRRDTDRD